MDLEETEARIDCADQAQQQFNRPTDRESVENWQPKLEVGSWKSVQPVSLQMKLRYEVGVRWSPACKDVSPWIEAATK
jgi:hypothetical protein